MQKLTPKNPMYKAIRDYYKHDIGDLKLEVVSNLMYNNKAKLLKNLDPKWNSFLKFLEHDDHLAKTIMILHANEMLKHEYGRCDFKFEGNREYKNWIVESEGLYFILSEKCEMVLPDTKAQSENLGNAVMGMYYELFNITLRYIKAHPSSQNYGNGTIQNKIKMLYINKKIVNERFVL